MCACAGMMRWVPHKQLVVPAPSSQVSLQQPQQQAGREEKATGEEGAGRGGVGGENEGGAE